MCSFRTLYLRYEKIFQTPNGKSLVNSVRSQSNVSILFGGIYLVMGYYNRSAQHSCIEYLFVCLFVLRYSMFIKDTPYNYHEPRGESHQRPSAQYVFIK